MASGATIHSFSIQLADVDGGLYEDLSLRVARHPSETDPFMMTRVLAYCLEYADGIAFTEGIASTDEPAVLVRDPTGAITAWIEVGAPAAARLHTGSMRSQRVAVYTHRDPVKVAAARVGKRIHRADEVRLHSFEPGFVDAAAGLLERRTSMTLSVVERRLYLEIGGTVLESDITMTPVP
ncbi:MAG: YaeQ family protein [Microbacterium sp.]|uniref:YaeQ family protein n=1 Tax=Microbacterium sp. TaxID=51671 RepID=UPI0039E46135